MPYREEEKKKPAAINRKYGWVRKERNVTHRVFAVNKVQSSISKVDLRPFCPPVYDQGELGSCFDDQTEILTENGWRLFTDINSKEKLATVNPITSELVYEIPTRLIKFHYNGDMIVGKNQYIDFKVTPDHNMLVRTWNQTTRSLNDNYEFVPAKDLGWYSGLMNRVQWNGDDGADDKYILPGINPKDEEQQCHDKSIPMNTWLKFLGIYLAEGCFCLNKGHYKIQISAVKEREKTFIRELFNDMKICFLELQDRFTFDDKQIYKELKRLGLKNIHAPYKFVPEFVFHQSSKNIKEFLLGHFSGDGREQRGLKCHYTSSYKLADDLQRLIFLSGNESGIMTRDSGQYTTKDSGQYTTTKDGRKFPEHRISVRECKNLSIDRKKYVTNEKYDGYVYCAEVPTYHTLITRRNYKILISGNCTANAIAAAYEFDELKQKEQCDFVPSRLFIYWGERSKEGTITEDAGADISDGINFINTVGLCPENVPSNNTVGITADECWPYDISKFSQKPPDKCFSFANKHKTLEAHAVQQTEAQLKQALINGFPVTIGIELFQSFETDAVAKTGLVPMPSIADRIRGTIGGHAVIIVGFDDNMMIHGEKGAFIIRNSWDVTWGDKGYFYLPYRYVLDRGLASDFWTITKVQDTY